MNTVKEKHPLIRVICSETDVFVLLYTMYIVKNWSSADVYMEDFTGEKSLKSIKKAVEKHKDIICSLLAVHAQTGCDTVSKMFGTGKGKALNVMKKITLQCLGEKDASYTDLSQRNLLPTVME